MSDEAPGEYIGIYSRNVERIIRESEARAKQIRATADVCKVCGLSMLRSGRSRHYACDPEYPLAGQMCTCPPECSDTHWGNGPRDCDPGCVPCRSMRGRALHKRRR